MISKLFLVVEASEHAAGATTGTVDHLALRHQTEAARLRAARPTRQRRVAGGWLASSAVGHWRGEAAAQVCHRTSPSFPFRGVLIHYVALRLEFE